MTARQIAIDGPAGAGKSTVARRVAAQLGYLYIDTGAMYRAVALLALEEGCPPTDENRLSELAASDQLILRPGAAGCRVFWGQREISAEIRQPEVGNLASPVSALPRVRQALVARQRALAAAEPVVMDGRDIGTVVLPQAQCKVFLTASPRVRAERRGLELANKGLRVDLDQVERDICQRDQQDSNRQHSPLRQAEDARLLDSSNLSIEQVVAQIIAWAEEK